jgi:LysM repeat protein
VTGRSPARLLAPLALVAVAVALYLVVSSDGGDGSGGTSGSPSPVATPTPVATRERAPKRRTYTVKAGDTPSAIAEEAGVSVDDLLAANPDADPTALSPGQKLRLPEK